MLRSEITRSGDRAGIVMGIVMRFIHEGDMLKLNNANNSTITNDSLPMLTLQYLAPALEKFN